MEVFTEVVALLNANSDGVVSDKLAKKSPDDAAAPCVE